MSDFREGDIIVFTADHDNDSDKWGYEGQTARVTNVSDGGIVRFVILSPRTEAQSQFHSPGHTHFGRWGEMNALGRMRKL